MEWLITLFRCFLDWRNCSGRPEDFTHAHAIVTQACSRLRNGSPGPGNLILAAVTRNLHDKYGLPILAQEEVPMAAPELPYAYIAGGSKDGKSTWSWNTYTIARLQARECDARGWHRVIVVTVPSHMFRALRVYEKLGLEAIPAPMPRRGYLHPKSVHWSARAEPLLYLRELLCRILFLLQRRI